MATVTGYTADHMDAMMDENIVSARIDVDHLILIKRDLTEMDLGSIGGSVGPAGPSSIIVCTSSTRPSGGALYEGLGIYETDTDRLLVYNGIRFDLPWNMPWGFIDSVALSGTGTNSGTLLVGTLSIAATANRKLKVHAQGAVYSAGDVGHVTFEIQLDGVTIGQMKPGATGVVGGDTQFFNFDAFTTPAAGTRVFRVKYTAVSSTARGIDATLLTPFLSVEDIGPNGVPA